MRRSLWSISATLLLALVAVFMLGTGANAAAPMSLRLGANPNSAAPQGQSAVQSKVSAALQQQFSAQASGSKLEYWVILADQADTSNKIPMSQWAAKGWYVYNTLKDKADNTQGPILSQLK